MDIPQKVNIVGTGVSTTSYEEVVRLCCDWAFHPGARSRYVCVTSVHGVIEARVDAELRIAIDQAEVATPDGMPLVWALRSYGWKTQQRVYGPTLMLHLCEKAAQNGLRIFLYGARAKTLDELRKRLGVKYPGLQIAGTYSPPFRTLTEREDAAVCQLVKKSRADILFVGLSTPKQEKWMFAHRDSIPGLTMIGVGAAFDFHAGRTSQAPAWVQRNGLEWLFRLLVEPRRLWRRYVLITPRFLPLWFKQWMFERPSSQTNR